MTEMGGITTVEHQGFNLTTNSGATSEEILERLNPPKEPVKEEPEDPSKAASTLGKLGGKAAAEKRKAQELAEETNPEEEAIPEKEVSEEPTEEKEEKEPEKLGKPKYDAKARMLEAARKETEARREAEKARAEAKAAQAERDAIKRELEAARAPKAPEPQETAKPIRSQFTSDEDFVEALTDWKTDQKFKAHEEKLQTETKVKEYAGTIDRILGEAVSARKEYQKTDPDFMDRVSDEVKELALKPSFARDLHEQLEAKHVIADEIIQAKKHGPLLMLYLSDHPDYLRGLQEMRTPQEIQVEMRVLAKSLSGAATTASVPKGEVSKALPPVRPVTGAPPNVVEEGHTPERASKQGLDEYARGWKPAKRR
jgi:hypothetical protein